MFQSLTTKALFAVGAATVTIAAASAPAEAFQVFTNRTAWQDAISALTNPAANPIVTETFSNNISPTLPFGPVTTPSGITVSSDGFGGVNAGLFAATLGNTTFGLPASSLGFGIDIRNQTDNVSNPTIIWTALDASGASIGTNQFVLSDGIFNFFGIVQDQVGGSLISSVQFSKTNPSVGILAGYDNASFATAIPTPALLPGMIGMGIAAWRKRKSEAANEAEA